ncbi:zinc ABC transporter substrate-binding protein [Aestuariicoccus sp. MJ-SS9]|uniref:zinc ABC transporter substrate-binding protein n=1 Tax=Aestuariicoccus sp. MJ-SS9 TaxID=3079855 RepID=UPI002910D16C|nr:zinc ABC transporter substrate-binding protein [Aestuariicoccus sp. MJ-SS9]MDU8912982.1 zinc ABC transporter substrate-binding protein [Aestuariicoccus sp. MJ-SS9]
MILRSLTAALLTTTAAWAEAPRVATDILPVHGLASMVMGDLGAPSLILPPGASPHDYALRPSEARALSEADIVFRIGAALAPGLDRPLDALAGGAQVVTLTEVSGTVLLDYRQEATFAPDDHDDHGHKHDDDHGHGHDDHDDDHGHDHGGEHDPHAWLAPDNAALWLDHMAAVLAEADPKNADRYRANAAAARAEIDAAVADAKAALATAEGPYVVFHDAYHYFEEAFDLPVLGAISASDAQGPSPSRLATLRDALETSDVTCLFSEPQFDPRLIAAVSEGTELPVAVLDPLGTDLPPGAGHYPALLRDMAQRIAGCAGQ